MTKNECIEILKEISYGIEDLSSEDSEAIDFALSLLQEHKDGKWVRKEE